MNSSRIPRFYQFGVEERLRVLYERGVLSDTDYRALATGTYILDPSTADRLTENVIGVFSMPLGLGLNFQINGKDYLVPMVVEEPSIIAAVSSAARLVRRSGGFESTADEPMLIGQVQVLDVPNAEAARQAILDRKQEILDLADAQHPNMVVRGGGAKDLEVFLRGQTAGNGELLVLHLLVDSRDAMGANLVNTMCEAIAPLVEEITGGRVFLRILSNLTDRAMVRSRCVIPVDRLGAGEFSGEQVRDGIVLAAEFAEMDPYRATTHNKGIMNGIDAVAIATGNDWRAIEAAAHAFAAHSGTYSPLTRWFTDADGNLVGEIELPLKVGIVGGQVESNPAVHISYSILGVDTAAELATVMAAVGLAQNFGALKALSTEGIQPGHMRLHARSVAVAAGASGVHFDEVVNRLVASGEVKVWKARHILDVLEGRIADTGSIRAIRTAAIPVQPAAAIPEPERAQQGASVGFGKIILLGEHSVVYGRHAIAAPIGLTIQAEVSRREAGLELVIARWDTDAAYDPIGAELALQVATLIVEKLGLSGVGMRVDVFPHLPRASGLGASAALAVAIIRAVADRFEVELTEEQISNLAFECEQIVHGTPSGIDNTVATFGRPILYRRAGEGAAASEIRDVVSPRPIPVVIGLTGVRSLTSHTVGLVRAARERHPARYEAIFSQIDELVLAGADALRRGDAAELGELMNMNHGLLGALQVSSPELEALVGVARRAGALGAKLTGGGGGGAMIAVAGPGAAESVGSAMRQAGFVTYLTEIR
ncbi:hydroxymethylglutaryl-CoA reductase, degradative [Parafrigoribacterium humi]|jgi:hydroxymethylglutaryl-CoA reductase|uniref:hydroxymethylglutaryl-CoA reductase, degradative n=1 Tax=Parafrigoribacterium humi TaxID=3144664 RepID=UPI0032EE8F01